jgi:hypothetical protein
MRSAIGINRPIQRAWLDLALEQLAELDSPDELRAFLAMRLQADLPGKARCARTAAIIARIWSDIPARVLPLRRDALAILPTLGAHERVWLHWGMTLVAFPFFRDVVGVVGRLLAHREEFRPAHVHARIHQQWDDQAATRQAVQKSLATLLDWGALQTGQVKKRFKAASRLSSDSRALQVWLLEAILRAGPAPEIEARQLRRLPEAFPFALDIKRSDIVRHKRLALYRHASGTERVSFCFHKSQGPFKRIKKKRKPVTNEQPAPGEEQAPRACIGPAERPFAAPLGQCALLFRDGQFYGSIALAHTLIEAVVRRVWQDKMNLRRTKAGTFRDNLTALCSMGVVSTELKTRLDRLWIERAEFLRLDATTPADQARLATIAEQTLETLGELERTLFGASGHFPGMSSQPREI